MGLRPKTPRSSDATSASIGLTLRYATGSPLRCGAPSSPHKVLRPCGGPYLPARNGCAVPKRGLNGAYKEPQTHFYRPRAGTRKGEPPPLSPSLRRGTMGKTGKYFFVFFPRPRQRCLPLRPPCGARKNHRAARLLDFFDRCGCSASLHLPQAALGSASHSPRPMVLVKSAAGGVPLTAPAKSAE